MGLLKSNWYGLKGYCEDAAQLATDYAASPDFDPAKPRCMGADPQIFDFKIISSPCGRCLDLGTADAPAATRRCSKHASTGCVEFICDACFANETGAGSGAGAGAGAGWRRCQPLVVRQV